MDSLEGKDADKSELLCQKTFAPTTCSILRTEKNSSKDFKQQDPNNHGTNICQTAAIQVSQILSIWHQTNSVSKDDLSSFTLEKKFQKILDDNAQRTGKERALNCNGASPEFFKSLNLQKCCREKRTRKLSSASCYIRSFDFGSPPKVSNVVGI